MIWIELTSLIREICLYLATFGYLTAGMNSLSSSLLILAASVLCCIASLLYHPDSILKYLPLAFCALMFVQGVSGAFPAAAVPVIVCLFLKIRSGHWSPGYSGTHTLLNTGTAGYAVMIFLLYVYETHLAANIARASVPFFTVFLILSVYNLRMLRNSAVTSFGNRYAAMNLIPIAAVTALSLLLTSKPARALASMILHAFYRYVLYPLLILFAFLMLGLLNVLKGPVLWLFALLGGSFGYDESEMGFESIGETFFPEVQTAGTPLWLSILWRALPALLLAVTAVWMIRRIMQNRGIAAESGAVYQREDLRGRKRGLIADLMRRPLTPVREIYRKYLLLCMKHNIAADGSMASDEIMKASSGMLKSGDPARLRELWLPVRYGRSSDTDGSEAAGLLKHIRKQFREN